MIPNLVAQGLQVLFKNLSRIDVELTTFEFITIVSVKIRMRPSKSDLPKQV